MATEIKIDITGVQELAARLDTVKREKALIEGLNLSGELLKGWIMRERLSGPRPQFLGVVTGRLRSSIATSGTKRDGDSLVNTIGTNVEYAPVHEFGATIQRKARVGSVFFKRYKRGAKAGKVLFSKESKATFGRKVSFGAHSIGIPARPFMRPSIEDQGNQSQILSILTEKLNEALSA